MRLVLYQPEIPQNAGTLMRLGACLGVAIDVIEPCGFVLDDRRLRRALMDYAEGLELVRHASWAAFCAAGSGRRVLLTTKATLGYTDFTFLPDDRLIVGQESAGVPAAVAAAVDAAVRVPLMPGRRSLNVALAAALVLGEALRQTGGLPRPTLPESDTGNQP